MITSVGKRVLLGILIGMLVFGSSGRVQADSKSQSINTEKQIQQIYDERASVLAERKEGYLQKYDELGKELESLGVKFLTPEEVQEKMEIAKRTYQDSYPDSVSPYVVSPSNNNYAWSSFRNTWVKNGVTYEVQHLTAEATSRPSILWETGGIVIEKNNSFQAAVQNLAITVAKAGASALYEPIGIAISVYDAVKDLINDANFDKQTEVTNIMANYTYGWYESIDFMYVKKVGESDDKQKLTFISSSVSGSMSWTIPKFTYKKSSGAIQSLSFSTSQKSFNYYDTTAHRNGSFAVAAYLDPYAPRNAYVTYAEMKGIDNKTVRLVPVATPASPFIMP